MGKAALEFSSRSVPLIMSETSAGRLGQLRAFDEHYEQVAWRIGEPNGGIGLRGGKRRSHGSFTELRRRFAHHIFVLCLLLLLTRSATSLTAADMVAKTFTLRRRRVDAVVQGYREVRHRACSRSEL